MHCRLERAKRMKDGHIVKKKGKDVYWDDLLGDKIHPEISGNIIKFKCAESTVVPSMLTSFAEILMISCDSIYNTVDQYIKQKNVEKTLFHQLIDKGKEAFSPVTVHTGVKVKLEKDEVLILTPSRETSKRNGLNGVNAVITPEYYNNKETDGEILIELFNIMPFNIKLDTGSIVAIGTIHKVVNLDQNII